MAKLIEFTESQITKAEVSENDWKKLQQKADFDNYTSLRQIADEMISQIEDDDIFAEIEWNLFQTWFNKRGFTNEDWRYVLSCGYTRNQFVG